MSRKLAGKIVVITGASSGIKAKERAWFLADVTREF
jgi:hypothetical protein